MFEITTRVLYAVSSQPCWKGGQCCWGGGGWSRERLSSLGGGDGEVEEITESGVKSGASQ